MKLREKIDGGKREESETASGMDLMKTGCMKFSSSKKMSIKVMLFKNSSSFIYPFLSFDVFFDCLLWIDASGTILS